MVLDAQVGVYVSVPFCRAKCSFCNFASGVGDGRAMERYVGQLCAEIAGARGRAERLGAALPERVDTVYFGGGTPSLMSPEQLGRVFAELRRGFELDSDAEITLEAAPGQIAPEVLDAAMRLGVNRVSLGVQSFVDRECAAVGRLHTGQDCVREIARLRAAGVAEVCADLIAGLPYQTAESWETSLKTATEVGLTHLSVYMLEVDEDSRLGREVLAGALRFHAPGVPADELSAEMYEAACAWLPGNGFGQYEISNFAAMETQIPLRQAQGNDSKKSETRIPCGNDKQRGHQSRHNRKYWERAPYIGFGLDAHSMLECAGGVVRFANGDELAGYPGVSETTVVGPRETFEETVFLGLRLVEGLNAEALRAAFRRDWVRAFEDGAREMVGERLMGFEDGCWRLTMRGRMVSNEVFGALLEGVAA
jgi:oxygen-independent coproporphyrinogen-3 oxidase